MEDILNSFNDPRYVIARFGSETSNESDILILDQTGNNNSLKGPLTALVNNLSNTSIPESIQVIVHHHHRAYVHQPRHALHFLFYPSRSHLLAWELPSFLAYIFLNAELLQGDLEFLRRNADSYAQRTILSQTPDLLHTQQSSYDKILCDSLIYLLQDASFYPLELINENIGYVTRFTLAEYYLATGMLPFGPNAWAWNTIIDETKRHFPHKTRLITMLKKAMLHTKPISKGKILKNIMELCSVRDEIQTRIREE